MRIPRPLTALLIGTLAFLGLQALPSHAYTPLTTIQIPGSPLVSNDIVWADGPLGRLYQADRSNAGIDVFDMRNNTFIGRIPAGGIGTATAPNGVATDSANQLLFFGGGASGAGDSFNVANAVTLAPITSIKIPQPSGAPAMGRADELAVDPRDRLVLIANDQDTPRFVTLLSYTPAGIPTIVGQVSLPQATNGVEQPVWVPETGQFMVALPACSGCGSPGAIAVFNISPFALARTIPLNCAPAGLAHGPDSLLFVGCTPAPEVVNFNTGALVATLGSCPSNDEVWFDPHQNVYLFTTSPTAACASPSTLFVYSAFTNQLLETDPLNGGNHNLAADPNTGNVFVALRPPNTTCPNGCIAVFTPPGPTPTPSNPLLNATATKSCAQLFQGTNQNPTGIPVITDCKLVITVPGTPGVAFGQVGFQDILLDPNACFLPGSSSTLTATALPSPVCSGGVTRVDTGPVSLPPPFAINFNQACPASVGETISSVPATPAFGAGAGLTINCALPPIAVTGPTTLCEELDLSAVFTTGSASFGTAAQKIQVCPPNPPNPPPVVNPLSGLAVTKSCTPAFTGAAASATKVTDCTLVFTTTSANGVFNNGTHLEFDTITGNNAAFSPAAVGGGGSTTTGCENGVGGGGVLSATNTTYTCIVGPIIVSGATTLCETVQLVDPLTGLSSAKLPVCPSGVTPTPVSSLNFTATKTCTAFVPPTITTGGTSVTDCTLVFSPQAGSAFPPDVFVADDTITSGNAGFSFPGCLVPLQATTAAGSVGNCIELTGTASSGFCLDSPTTGVISGFTLTCHLPPIVVSALPNTLCETVELGSASLGFSSKVQVCPTAPPTPVNPIVSNFNQPNDEQKTCTNTTSVGGLSQVVGASTQPLGVSGPGKTFTIPLVGPASTCAIQLLRGGTPCNLTTNTCADGYVVVTLTSPGTNVAIACGSATLPTGQTLPTVSGGAGTCQPQDQGQQLFIPCGTTATTGGATATTQSNTCTGVLFDIQSLIGACLNSPTTACTPGILGNGINFTNFQGGVATVTVNFIAVGAPTGGTVGGINLGTNTFNIAAPGVGTLLVSAAPAIIPSNGTLASVITATFACGSGFSVVNGIPLSNLLSGVTSATNATFIANQPILGNGSAVCGAGLPGTFTFSTNGPVIFDNGRQLESVNCGAGGNVSPFGVGSTFFPSNQTTFPVVLSCTGAAVLAIGAGVAGDAAINVTYTSAIGGLTAVGSTLLTVSPSGVPRISVQCNPSTIAAGSTGSICTATVTDINGVPLNGLTGATVTWTTSDPANASILPCLVNIPGSINITTSPNIIPQITPNTPCQVPTAQLPGQNNTFLNGQASALLVASPTAHPETVTVTASLGVLIPPSFSCLVAPFLPTGFGTTTTPFAPVTGVGLPGVSGCGSASPVGFSGLASAFSGSSLGLTGIVTLPNTTSASTTVNIGGVAGILIAGAGPNTPVQLGRGCNQVIVTTTVGTPIANIAALVSPASAVVSIWRFSNATKQFQAGFFSDPNAPTDFATTGAISGTGVTGTTAAPGTNGNQITETYFICVNQAATITSG